MMQEVESEVQEVSTKLEETKIADQLQDAALTDVTQAIPQNKEETPPRNTVAPAPQPVCPVSSAGQQLSQLTTPDTTPLAPPTTGFVPSPGLVATTPIKTFAAVSPPSPSAINIMDYVVPGTPHVVSDSDVAHSTVSQEAAQLSQVETSAKSPLVASSSIDLEETASVIGPVYPTPNESKPAGLFGWLPGRNIVSKVVQKTKSSMETVITTLDPGMKDVIHSGGDIDIVVASSKEVKVAPVRQAFQEVFGKATVSGQDSQPHVAPQPVGYTAGLKGAEERIENLIRSGAVHEKQVIVSIESFIEEILPDRWFDIACIVLKDPINHIQLEVFSQATPVPSQYVELVKEQTPSDYNLRWSGLSVTIGQVINQQTPHILPSDWHQHFTGISRQQMLCLSSKTLAGLYKQRLQYTVSNPSS